ncbi:MAG: type IV-A pilus assembly ATPase PilB [bacterium]|nr:type IV-A pilus assembly ATPase PilB [bacterium]
MSSQVGEILVERRIITREQLNHALKESSQSGSLLPSCIVEIGLAPEKAVYDAISDHYKIPYMDVKNRSVDETLIKLVPHEIATKHAIMPIGMENEALLVAVADPSDMVAINDLKFATGLDVKLVLSSELSIRLGQDRIYSKDVAYDRIIDDIRAEALAASDAAEAKSEGPIIEKIPEDAPIIQLVDAILSDAIRKNASDIHIEPYEQFYRVRFRIDGVMHEIMRPPIKLRNPLISRIKVMASLDISERRLPQDGRIKLKMSSGVAMDFRVNSLPTLFGEKIVMRLLDKSNLQLDIAKLGFDTRQLKDFRDAIHKPFGMILVTGPTGSGKSTTLYSALTELNKVTTNIFTAEDPVEYNLPGINQVQVNDEIDFTFASALRAFLRQDPDVIMVGEIRDVETAEIAIKASLTGHLVLSTLHTNDAPSTIGRLLNMGIEPFLIASSLNLVIAQRLLRKICQNCTEDYQPTSEVLKSLGIPVEAANQLVFKKGAGCTQCAGTGYKGRMAIYEVMPLYDEIRAMIFRRASVTEIKQDAIQQGVASLRLSAINRLLDGITTVEEVFRVTDSG